MTLLLVAVGIAVVAGVAVLVARDRPLLDEDPVDRRVMAWPPQGAVGPQDLADARFAIAVRGYRMDEVDRVLDDARQALAQRDARIADLERVLAVLAPRSAGLADAAAATGAAELPDPATATDPPDAPGAHPAGQR